MKVRNISLALGLTAALITASPQSFAQTPNLKAATPIAASAPTAVPSLVPYSGAVVLEDGKLASGEAGVTFQIFKDEAGGEALWSETQTVAIDSMGHYKVQLGATNPNGLPSDLFSTGEARWLEVQVTGQTAQPRVLLASVPYALKAGDATTLGGLPASAFALAGPKSAGVASSSQTVGPNANATVTTPGGTTGYLPLFTGAATIADSQIFDNGTDVGIGTTTPTATLDVVGTAIITGGLNAQGGANLGGSVNILATGNASASAGKTSQPLAFVASSYNSTSHAAVPQIFRLEAEPTGNDTASPSGTLNLLFGSTPAETGLYFNSNGTINFAAGQTFPGTGKGTITGVTAGTALTGGGSSGNVTLNLDLTKIPELATANTFTTSQTITNGDLNLPATSSSTVGVLNIGGVPFLQGFASGKSNVFVGDAGNFTTTGDATTAVGFVALVSQTTGYENTAVGYGSLYKDTTGFYNTAVGNEALLSNTTGGSNTAIGAFSGPTTATLSNTTAIGVNARVAQSSSLVLGNTNATTPGAEFVNVGIGTATPTTILEVSASAQSGLGPSITLTNPGGGQYAESSVDFNTEPVPANLSSYVPGARIAAVDDGENGDYITLAAKNFNTGILDTAMYVYPGSVGIGTEYPDAALEADAVTSAWGVWGSGAASGYAGVDGFGGISGGGEGAGAGGQFYGGTSVDTTAGGDGVQGYPGTSNGGGAVGYAGYFQGNVDVTGTLYAEAKDFKIDHPLDPANKYLVHTSVESSEMMNIYTGNVTTDELGIATITLPEWFQSLNTDYRYQLTTIGRDAHAWVSQEVANNQFKISTNATNVKVSWQITAVRQDAYAKANPLVVEQEKPEKGFYIHPELFGQPNEKQTQWGRHPQEMQRMKAATEAKKNRLTAVPAKARPAQTVLRPTAPNLNKAEARPVGAIKP